MLKGLQLGSATLQHVRKDHRGAQAEIHKNSHHQKGAAWTDRAFGIQRWKCFLSMFVTSLDQPCHTRFQLCTFLAFRLGTPLSTTKSFMCFSCSMQVLGRRGSYINQFSVDLWGSKFRVSNIKQWTSLVICHKLFWHLCCRFGSCYATSAPYRSGQVIFKIW